MNGLISCLIFKKILKEYFKIHSNYSSIMIDYLVKIMIHT